MGIFPGEGNQGSPALNTTVNIVNSSLAILLPFALVPLARFTTSPSYLGEYAAKRVEATIIWIATTAVYVINAFSLSSPGGGFFGDLMIGVTKKLTDGTTLQMQTFGTVQYNILNDIAQVIMLLYILYFAFVPIDTPMRDVHDPRPVEKEGEFGVVETWNNKDDGNSPANESTAEASVPLVENGKSVTGKTEVGGVDEEASAPFFAEGNTATDQELLGS